MQACAVFIKRCVTSGRPLGSALGLALGVAGADRCGYRLAFRAPLSCRDNKNRLDCDLNRAVWRAVTRMHHL